MVGQRVSSWPPPVMSACHLFFAKIIPIRISQSFFPAPSSQCHARWQLLCARFLAGTAPRAWCARGAGVASWVTVAPACVRADSRAPEPRCWGAATAHEYSARAGLITKPAWLSTGSPWPWCGSCGRTKAGYRTGCPGSTAWFRMTRTRSVRVGFCARPSLGR